MTTILVDIGDEEEVIAEERQDWLQRVLAALGADAELISDNSMEAKEHLMMLGIDVWRGADGSIKVIRPDYATIEVPSEDPERQVDEVDVSIGHKVIAEWNKPEIIRVRESPGKAHSQIKLNEWALPFQMGDV